MKASELRPGQFFEFDGKARGRCLFLGPSNDPAFPYSYMRRSCCEYGYDIDSCRDFDVTPLAVTGWDDVPQSEPAPLQLREGAWYRSVGGDFECKPIDWDEHANILSKEYWQDIIPFEVGGNFYNKYGHNVGPFASSSRDLIAEVPPPEPEHNPKPQQGDHYDYMDWIPPPVEPSTKPENYKDTWRKFSEAREQLRKDIYADVFDTFRLMPGQKDSIESQAERLTKKVMQHCQQWALMDKVCSEETRREIAKIVAEQPDADGWIEWRGGEWKGGFEGSYDLRFRNGREYFNQAINNVLMWQHSGSGVDIVAYRLAKPQPAPQTDWTITVTR